MALDKRKVREALRELKAHHKTLAAERDKLRELLGTIEELGNDAHEAVEDVEAAIEKLSRLQ